MSSRGVSRCLEASSALRTSALMVRFRILLGCGPGPMPVVAVSEDGGWRIRTEAPPGHRVRDSSSFVGRQPFAFGTLSHGQDEI